MKDAAADLASIRALLQAGQFEPAINHCMELVQALPDLWEAWYLLGCACRGAGDLANAQMALRGVLQAQPDNLPALRELAQVLELMDELVAATEIYRRIYHLDPTDSFASLKRGDILSALGRSSDALACYRAVLAGDPDNLAGLLSAGHAARALGEKPAAIDNYRRACRAHPTSGTAWHSLANLKDYVFSDAELDAMEHSLAAGSEQDAAALGTLFALGSAYDQRGEFDRAWSCYRRGNRLGESLRPWSAEAFQAEVDAVIEAFPAQQLAVTSRTPPSQPSPIFIVGLPRSGSTLVEQILASHSAIEGTRELPSLPRLTRSLRSRSDPRQRYPHIVASLGPGDLELLGRDYLNACAPQLRSGRAFFTDKLPNNFLHIGFIQMLFPGAPIVHVYRNPLDCCVANLRHHFARQQNFAYSEERMAHYFNQYRRLMAHWEGLLPGRIVNVGYEQLVTDPEGEITRLLEALGVGFEESCQRFYQSGREVHTASSEQVRQPIYTSSIGIWKRYAAQLGDLQALLAR
ncbi:tetratricopeptide repeat-containing sulfotransferase family protein [Haliea sp. E17]|uniref:tetratricopeptide repeat-containing sulfotransferase family protein n=1 Tax=Haliea sp. E17 TaxID=3401576 RepID=UPI003AAF1446